MATHRNSFDIALDATDLPTLEQLQKYDIGRMFVRRSGPGGGNPFLILGFNIGGAPAGYGHDNARKFIREWLGEGVDDSDVEFALNSGVSEAAWVVWPK
jgi:hypothetical protein